MTFARSVGAGPRWEGDVVEFDDLVRQATNGNVPYPYQRDLARNGPPNLLEVPTGSGKTLAAVLPWVFRRRFSGSEIAAETPPWLVFVLPMRVLVEQTEQVVSGWLANLDLADEVEVHTLLGGEAVQRSWRERVGLDTVIVGTLDMVLSRAINRGYGENRFMWPVDMGLLNSGCHYVFDEIQLMGPALVTSRQLHGVREQFGTIGSCTSMWMSATVCDEDMLTVDAPEIRGRAGLGDADRVGPLATRLGAQKRIHRLDPEDGDASSSLQGAAAVLVADHQPGTLSLAVVNTVSRARDLEKQLRALGAPTDDVVLLHSRFRPPDRRAHAQHALGPVDPASAGRIVISTQVVEAGVDISARLLVTDVAPWPSIVQRIGRCNRAGEHTDAVVRWIPADAATGPYPPADVAAAATALAALEGTSVSPAALSSIDVEITEVIHPTIRRKDLLDLFDTTPDISGNDIDVSPYIRPADDSDITIAWRELNDAAPAPDAAASGRDERCPVPIGEARRARKKAPMWVYDARQGRYTAISDAELRPGLNVIVDSSTGMYTSAGGWNLESKGPVEVVVVDSRSPSELDLAVGDDPNSLAPSWLALPDHLADTEREAIELVQRFVSAIPAPICKAAVRAAALHDIGKAHPIFQRSMHRLADASPVPPGPDVALAKSGGHGRLVHDRRYFRHELASALCLLGEGAVALEDVEEQDLVVFLVAAHHGRVRVGIRAMPDDRDRDGRAAVLGVCDEDVLPSVEWPGGEVPASALDLGVVQMGERGGRPSWTARALGLRDRADLGPFRLATLEAIVRLADWKASASPGGATADG